MFAIALKLFIFSLMCAVIELACGEYGEDKIGMLIEGSENGRTLEWMENQNLIEPIESCTGNEGGIIISTYDLDKYN